MWVAIQSGGVVVATGYSSLTFIASVGTTYQISVANYGSYLFNHWADGSTSATYTVSPVEDTTFTAYYNTP